jgi:hypothetical protein
VHDPNKNLDVNIAIENDTPPVRAYQCLSEFKHVHTDDGVRREMA